MAASFSIRGRSNGAPPTPGKELKIPGTKDNLVGRDGDLSAYDRKDLLQTIGHLVSLAGSGSGVDFSDGKPVARSPKGTTTISQAHAQQMRENQDMLVAAYNDRSSNSQWAELGSVIAATITESADREGFMRRVLMRADLQQGNFPRIRVRKKNVTAMIMTGPSMLLPQYLLENWMFPPEFTISANIRVQNKELNQGSGDLLEEKFYEGQESIMVQEDRNWKFLADSTVGIDHQLKYLIGGLNPSSFTQLRTELARFNITPLNCIMAADFWNDITGNTQFSSWFDPVTKYEIISTGELGQMLGLTFITDGFRQEQLKVLNPGELYIVGDPQMHGAYTDRGPVQSNQVDQYADGIPARGWFMFEEMSMVIANSRSVIKGQRA